VDKPSYPDSDGKVIHCRFRFDSANR
jgi:hypothetical protein